MPGVLCPQEKSWLSLWLASPGLNDFRYQECRSSIKEEIRSLDARSLGQTSDPAPSSLIRWQGWGWGQLGEAGGTAGAVPPLTRSRRSLEAKGNDVPSLVINILPKTVFPGRLIQRPQCLRMLVSMLLRSLVSGGSHREGIRGGYSREGHTFLLLGEDANLELSWGTSSAQTMTYCLKASKRGCLFIP